MLDHLNTLLLVADAFPQFRCSPLRLITPQPEHRRLHLTGPLGAINADLFLPAHRRTGRPCPGLVFAMGVKTAYKDRPVILRFGQTLSRLGFAVIWPRSAALDLGASLLESPQTLLAGFRYLESLPAVDRARLSFFGFSIGSSAALVAASDPQIAARVRAVVFFGGLFNARSFLQCVAGRSLVVDGHERAWEPDPEACEHVRSILEHLGAGSLLKALHARDRHEAGTLLDQADDHELEPLLQLSPLRHVDRVRAPVFILHDRGDNFVPFTESVALESTLGGRAAAFLLVDLFEHIRPERPIARESLRDLRRLYGFVRLVLRELGTRPSR